MEKKINLLANKNCFALKADAKRKHLLNASEANNNKCKARVDRYF